MRRLPLVLACLLGPVLAAANPPNEADFEACSRGESQREVQVEPVEFANLYQDDHSRSGYAVTYAIKSKKRIGFAVKGEQQGIFYEGRVYPIDHAETIDISPDEYREQLRHLGISFSQPADWYLVSHAGSRRYLCIALGQLSKKSPAMVYFLPLDKQHAVYFWVEKSP
jgi:hypothetical protein